MSRSGAKRPRFLTNGCLLGMIPKGYRLSCSLFPPAFPPESEHALLVASQGPSAESIDTAPGASSSAVAPARKSIAERYELAKDLDVPCFRRLRKNELIHRIVQVQHQPGDRRGEAGTWGVKGILDVLPEGYGFKAKLLLTVPARAR